MFLRRLFSKPRAGLIRHNAPPPRPRTITTPSSPSSPSPSPLPSSSTSSTKSATRIQSIIARLPRPLQRYASPLLHAPATHITSFLILHEITAVIPLLGLAGLFHYTNWLPQSWTEGKYVREGVERFGRWFGRKGWFGFTIEESGIKDDGSEVEVKEDEGSIGHVEGVDFKGGVADQRNEGIDVKGLESEVEQRWGVGENGGRILVEVATAYAITKVFLPARILVSVWGTPWFAKAVLGRFGGLFSRKGTDAITKIVK